MMKPPLEVPDLAEKGRNATGEVIRSDRRLYIQLLAFGQCSSHTRLAAALQATTLRGALYLDLHDPRGVGVAVAHDHPDFFVTDWREFLNNSPFKDLQQKPAFTMFGRSYSLGYEADLDHVLIHRPLNRLTNPDMPWHVWYPLRRSGSFEKLTAEDQRSILAEHGTLGASFSAGDYGQDIRLACHGLDNNDNDFIIGLVGKELFPLSAMVQAMRKTRQTSEFIAKMGPFFIGKAVWQRGLA